MSERLDFLRANSNAIKAIAARHKVISIAVFGSVARGEDGPDSDVDLTKLEINSRDEDISCTCLSSNRCKYCLECRQRKCACAG